MDKVVYEVEKTKDGKKRMQAYAELFKAASDKKAKGSKEEK